MSFIVHGQSAVICSSFKMISTNILKGEQRKSVEADQESKGDQETVEAPPQKRQKRNSLGNSTVTKNK